MNKPIQFPPPPPLEQGDHLSRAEFERRYNAMPQLSKAELIDGVVHMPSPVRWNQHGSPHADFITFLGVYKAHTPGISSGDNSSVRLDLNNEPQPDGVLLIKPEYGGQAVISEDDYVEGGPELAAEIAASSVSMDLHKKLEAYERNRVREYVVWRVQDEQIDWFVSRQGKFTPLVQDDDSILRSEAFAGLWLDVPALLRGDLLGVLDTLRRGIDSPEHAEFVASLRKKSGDPS